MKPKMLLVCHGYPFESIGGVGHVVKQLTEHLPKLDWDVHVLVPATSRWMSRVYISSTPLAWGTLHCLHRPIRRWSQSWSDKRTNDQLLEWVSRLKPDTVHIHHVNGLPWEWVIDGKDTQRYRLWLTLHDYALPCARGQLLHRYLERCEGPQTNRCTNCLQPWLTLDGWMRTGSTISHLPEGIVSKRIALAHRLLSTIDRIDAPSQHLITQFRRLYPSLTVEHCHLPMPKVERTEAQRFYNHDNHRFLFVGSVHPSKGIHLALRAFTRLQRNHSRISLTIIGHHSASDIVPSYVRIWRDFANSFPNVDWLGSRSHEFVLHQMLSHHTLVLPSVWPENSPIVVREALQRGMHVICGNGGSFELSPSILRAEPLCIRTLTQRMKEVMNLPSPTSVTYPSPEKTIAEWIGQAIDSTV